MLDFPNAPSVGQVFTSGGLSWQWDGTKWVVTDAGTNPVPLPISLGGTAATTLPKDPLAGVGGSLLASNGTTVFTTAGPGALAYIGVDNTYGQLYQTTFGVESSLNLSRANGTVGSPTAVLLNQVIGWIGFQGYGTNWSAAQGTISVRAGENFTASARGAYMLVELAVVGTLTPRQSFMLDSIGNITTLGITSGVGPPTYNTFRPMANPTAWPASAYALGGYYNFITYNGLTGLPLNSGGAFKAVTSEAWSATAQGTELQFMTTVNGTSTMATKAYLRNNGDIEILGSVATKVGGGAWVAPSDIRLKQDVEDFNQHGLDTVLALNPIKFRYNGKGGIADTETVFVGLDADETASVLPEIVGKMRVKLEAGRVLGPKDDLEEEDLPDTDVATVDPSALVYVLINAVKALNARIDELEGKLP